MEKDIENTAAPSVECRALFAVDTRGPLARLRDWLWPSGWVGCPETDWPARDVVVSNTVVELSCMDRLRVLVSGRLAVNTKTMVEHSPGRCLTAGVSYPLAPQWTLPKSANASGQAHEHKTP